MHLLPPSSWELLPQGRPGHRFRARYHRHRRSRRSRGFLFMVLRLVLAVLAFCVGVVLVFIPGPAVVFFLIAGALLATDWLFAARLLDWLEVRVRRLIRVARRIWEGWSTAVRVAFISGVVLLGVGSAFFFYRFLH